MSLLNVFFIAVGLAMDAFAVSLATGCSLGDRVRPGNVVRMAGAFGLFQALMPLIGWLGGSRLADSLSAFDHWIALVLLAAIGIKMLVEGVRGECETPKQADPTRGMVLLMLAVATSIDALAVGLSFGLVKSPIVVPAAIIGVVAAAFSSAGILFGRRLGCTFGKRMEVVGGLILVLIGAKIAFEHYMKQI